MDIDGNIHIKNVEFPATQGLWELLTRKRVDKKLITNADLKQYKTILKMTNAHLEGYDPEANIRISKGNKFMDVISRLFPGGPDSGVEAALRREWVTYKVMLRRLFTDPPAPSAFSSLHKLQQAVRHAPSSKQQTKKKTPTQKKEWLETQDAFTLHRPLRKRFPRNPYTVNNIDDVWELDILDLSSLKKFNNNYRYLL